MTLVREVINANRNNDPVDFWEAILETGNSKHFASDHCASLKNTHIHTNTDKIKNFWTCTLSKMKMLHIVHQSSKKQIVLILMLTLECFINSISYHLHSAMLSPPLITSCSQMSTDTTEESCFRQIQSVHCKEQKDYFRCIWEYCLSLFAILKGRQLRLLFLFLYRLMGALMLSLGAILGDKNTDIYRALKGTEDFFIIIIAFPRNKCKNVFLTYFCFKLLQYICKYTKVYFIYNQDDKKCQLKPVHM